VRLKKHQLDALVTTINHTQWQPFTKEIRSFLAQDCLRDHTSISADAQRALVLAFVSPHLLLTHLFGSVVWDCIATRLIPDLSAFWSAYLELHCALASFGSLTRVLALHSGGTGGLAVHADPLARVIQEQHGSDSLASGIQQFALAVASCTTAEGLLELVADVLRVPAEV
jgi:hypothetical protein